MIRPDIGACSDHGSRDNNEDAWSVPPGLTPGQAAAKGLLFIVADGMGGHQAGEVASHMAVQTIQQLYYETPHPDVGVCLQAAIEEANRRIYHDAISDSQRYGMGTTLTAAVLRGTELTVAHVGDSRAYLVRNGGISQLTRDHTWVAERKEAGILTEEEARTHPQRNVVTRALGNGVEVQVDMYAPLPVTSGDALLLCSDGLSEMVSDQELAAIVRQSRSAAEASSQLVSLTLSRGAPDNVTALVVRLGGRAAPAGPGGSRASILGVLAGLLLVGALVGGVVWMLTREQPTSPPIAQAPAATATPPSPASSAEAASLVPSAMPTVSPGATPAGSIAPPATSPAGTTTITLAEPADGQSFTAGSPVTLRWNGPALGADERFWVALRGEGAGLLAGTWPADGTEYQLKPLPPDTYTWLVLVRKGTGGEVQEMSRSKAGKFIIAAASPTATPASQAAATPTPPAVGTGPTATPPPDTQAAQPAAPQLVSPEDNKTVPTTVDKIPFRWRGTYGPGQGFEIRLWRDRDDMVHPGACDARETTAQARQAADGSYQFDCRPSGEGIYYWTVAVVQLEPYGAIGPEAPPRMVIYGKPEGGGDKGGGKGPKVIIK